MTGRVGPRRLQPRYPRQISSHAWVSSVSKRPSASWPAVLCWIKCMVTPNARNFSLVLSTFRYASGGVLYSVHKEFFKGSTITLPLSSSATAATSTSYEALDDVSVICRSSVCLGWRALCLAMFCVFTPILSFGRTVPYSAVSRNKEIRGHLYNPLCSVSRGS